MTEFLVGAPTMPINTDSDAISVVTIIFLLGKHEKELLLILRLDILIFVDPAKKFIYKARAKASYSRAIIRARQS